MRGAVCASLGACTMEVMTSRTEYGQSRVYTASMAAKVAGPGTVIRKDSVLY